MAHWSVDPVGSHRAGLGEGPIWDGDRNRLIWVDIRLHRLYFTDFETGETTLRDLPGSPGCAGLTNEGGVVLAIGQELMLLSGEGGLSAIAALPHGHIGRFNDGKPDAAGRFWVGTATAEGHYHCALWRFEAGLGFAPVVPEVSMSNGIGWSPDGRSLYYVDTLRHRVDVLAFDPLTGKATDRKPWFELPKGQLPDGLCVDLYGCVWLAIWGQSCVLRLTPSGDVDGRVDLPTPLVTSCAFGGPDYRTLFITTASEDDADPDAGRLFATDVGAQGAPPNRVRLAP